MKKMIVPALLAFALVFTALVPACSSGVDKNQYDRALAELTTVRDKKAKAEVYALFLDLIMAPLYMESDLPARYQFSSADEWFKAVESMSKTLADPEIESLVAKMKTNLAYHLELQKYVIDQIVTTLESK
jgi:hypothetical protein